MRENRFKDFREDKNLTQKEVADFLGISLTTYRNYEYGNYEASYSVLLSLSRLFGVSINKLLGERNNNLDLSDKELDLLKQLKELLEKKLK